MSITPAHVGVAAGGITTVAATLASRELTGRHMERNPTGSSGDRFSTIVNGGLGVAGFATMAASVMLPSSPSALGAGIGAGLLLGGVAGALSFSRSHGVGVDAEQRSIFGRYDHNRNDQLDLDPRWRLPEDIRYVDREHEHDHGNGDVHVHTDRDWYQIRAFASRADANDDATVTRQEATVLIAGYDADGDGRLKGSERREYHRDVGERPMYDYHGGTRW